MKSVPNVPGFETPLESAPVEPAPPPESPPAGGVADGDAATAAPEAPTEPAPLPKRKRASRGGKRSGAGRPRKAASSPVSGAPELDAALAAAPAEMREALTTLMDPTALAALLVPAIEGAAVAVASTRYGDKAQGLAAPPEQKAMVVAATGVYLQTLDVQVSPAQMLLAVCAFIYAPRLVALEGERRAASASSPPTVKSVKAAA